MNLEKRGFPIHKFLLEFGLLRAGVEMDQNIVMVIVYAHVTLRRRNSYGRRCFNKTIEKVRPYGAWKAMLTQQGRRKIK